MRVVTKAPFGASSQMEMLLEFATQAIKIKWMEAFKQRNTGSGGARGALGNVVIEGYLNKLKSFPSSNKVRFFVLTDKEFAYYSEEAGEMKGSCPIGAILSINLTGDGDCFTVTAVSWFPVLCWFRVLTRSHRTGASRPRARLR